MYFLYSICSFLTVIALIPPLRKIAINLDFVDRPNSRKIHIEPVPHLASIAIFLGFIIPYLVFIDWNMKSAAILIGALLVIGIGLIDDWYKTKAKDFPAWPKLIVQVAAAVIAFSAGITFEGFTNPFTQEMVLLPVWLQFVLTILWIFGVTTVINFMDGLDGLSGGVSAIAAITLFLVALSKGQIDSAIMSILLVGATLGYLIFNKPPAKIYMGDAGATFIGFLLGVIALDGAFKQVTAISIFIPVLALGVPIADNLYVIVKRMLAGKPIYQADRSQMHYRLLSAGLTQKQTVLIIYLMSTCLSLASIILLLINI
ncbi:MraY family glycosyltransferase [Paenibacillus sp. KN14-4R]|uniref:MraY family glycosyltransferase n=1 Tax=Paenibacillus sp. KN14-4R TaxID=3445773 RepID=UPI003FA0F9CC